MLELKPWLRATGTSSGLTISNFENAKADRGPSVREYDSIWRMLAQHLRPGPWARLTNRSALMHCSRAFDWYLPFEDG